LTRYIRPEVYHQAMGLFRNRARKKREKAAPGPVEDQTATVTTPPEAARREVTAEARPNPDQPGWGRTIGQQIGRARENGASHD
jgi:hypothetical protein